ncbi:MAG: molybdopterin molybdotransferase MoeA [Crocinitomicaceae bacterium]|nr:molybdopterin molybdotransferase MoeA [Crocinitomicaceae bacterium]
MVRHNELELITVEEAIKIIDLNSSLNQKTEQRPLLKGEGFVLSEDVISPINMPPFRQSAMDGYAINMHDSNQYSLIGEIQAGDSKNPTLKKGEAVRIFTGAAVPDSANCVVMQEKVIRNKREIEVQNNPLLQANIRPLGEQSKIGEIALKKGTLLNPAAIGFLTTLGITSAKVYKKPSIAVIATGNELVAAGQSLKHGQIYESNSLMLSVSLNKYGYQNNETYNVPDDYNSTLKLLKNTIENKDIVIVSGGISVGDYDYVGKALTELKTKELFYKIKQKPGKPLYFGKNNHTFIFALPGNPAAALSCFYIYVLRHLKRMCGESSYEPKQIEATSNSNYLKKGDRAQFLKAFYQEGKIEILEGQSSSMLHTFAIANALVYLSSDAKEIVKGDLINAILL